MDAGAENAMEGLKNTQNLQNISSLSDDNDDGRDKQDLDHAMNVLEHTMSSGTVAETKSLFNVSLDESYSFDSMDEKIERYKESAENQSKDWLEFLRAEVQQIKNEPTEILATPSDIQKQYLAAAPDIKDFIRGSIAFMKNATIFLDQAEDIEQLKAVVMEKLQYKLDCKFSERVTETQANFSTLFLD